MKRIIFLVILTPTLFCSCSKQISFALTAKQEATIIEEVIGQHDIFVSALTQINYELWADCYSEDNFISAFGYPVIGTFNYDKWMNSVKYYFSKKERHKTDLYEIIVTPLSPEVAISTQVGSWENWWKDGTYTKAAFNASFLWKKEEEGWKIVHVNETWSSIDN